MIPRKWEVWLVDMPFEEVEGSKPRPALVIDSQTQSLLVGTMTQHPPRDGYPNEYQLIDWKGAGLSIQTTLRLSKMVKLPPSSFLQKMGIIRTVDQVNIRNMLREIAAKKE